MFLDSKRFDESNISLNFELQFKNVYFYLESAVNLLCTLECHFFFLGPQFLHGKESSEVSFTSAILGRLM